MGGRKIIAGGELYVLARILNPMQIAWQSILIFLGLWLTGAYVLSLLQKRTKKRFKRFRLRRLFVAALQEEKDIQDGKLGEVKSEKGEGVFTKLNGVIKDSTIIWHIIQGIKWILIIWFWIIIFLSIFLPNSVDYWLPGS